MAELQTSSNKRGKVCKICNISMKGIPIVRTGKSIELICNVCKARKDLNRDVLLAVVLKRYLPELFDFTTRKQLQLPFSEIFVPSNTCKRLKEPLDKRQFKSRLLYLHEYLTIFFNHHRGNKSELLTDEEWQDRIATAYNYLGKIASASTYRLLEKFIQLDLDRLDAKQQDNYWTNVRLSNSTLPDEPFQHPTSKYFSMEADVRLLLNNIDVALKWRDIQGDYLLDLIGNIYHKHLHLQARNLDRYIAEKSKI